MTNFRSWTTVLVLSFILAGLASAQPSWQDVRKKIQSAKDYSVKFNYKGPQGHYEMDYRYANQGKNIRTEILKSKTDKDNIGTIIVFDEAFNPKRVRAKIGGGLISRNITHKDVDGRCFHQGIYQMILREIGSQKPTTKAAGNFTEFKFPDGYKVKVDKDGNIVETKRKDNRKPETRRFSGHQWNTSPKTGFKD